jgi:hypothetical protein
MLRWAWRNGEVDCTKVLKELDVMVTGPRRIMFDTPGRPSFRRLSVSVIALLHQFIYCSGIVMYLNSR